jgi:glycosyltransferase involved in cell wall biosynthesis
MILFALATIVFICAVVPALVFITNLRSYIPPLSIANLSETRIAVLIPARNEEENIGAALECVLASIDVDLEVLVLDDASTDATARIVEEFASRDARIKLLRSAALPGGWNGKQHACWQLAKHAGSPVMLFLDADVRLAPDAITRMLAFQQTSGAALVSGFPRLITIGFMEWLLLPLIHFVLLGFLPLQRMRATTMPAMAAGCGQFMMVDRDAYFTSGGHEAIRATMHDGLLLPRAFRNAGFRTDLADLTPVASVRMYDTPAKVWQGLAKNATEGIASPTRIVPVTLLLIFGQIIPTLLAVIALATGLFVWRQPMFILGIQRPWLAAVWSLGFLVALIASYLPRLLAVHRFKQPLKSALLHPLGVGLLLCVQWYALLRQVMGRPVSWRQRTYVIDSELERKPLSDG